MYVLQKESIMSNLVFTLDNNKMAEQYLLLAIDLDMSIAISAIPNECIRMRDLTLQWAVEYERKANQEVDWHVNLDEIEF